MSQGILAHEIIRMKVAAELRRQGHSFGDARELSHGLSDTVISSAIQQTDGAVGAIGDGVLLQKLIDFISSPTGQALIALLIKLILGGA